MLSEFRHLRPDDVGAIALRGVTREILLMVRLCLKPLARRRHFRNDWIGVETLLSDCRNDLLGDVLLLGRVIKDRRPILCPAVVALPVERRRIMDDEKNV